MTYANVKITSILMI
jgi:hypothetical protein